MSGELTTGVGSTAVTRPRVGPVSAGRRASLGREASATFAIAWREVLRAVKSPLSLAFTVIFPILFIGILGGSISQNMGNALSFAYLPYMLIGMIANTMYQGTITGRHQPGRGARERLHGRAVRRADLALRGPARQADRVGDRRDVLAGRHPRHDRRHADPDGRWRPAPGHRPDAGPGARGRRARHLLHRPDPGPEDRRDRRPVADLPAAVPVRGAHPGRQLDGHSWACSRRSSR